MERVCEGKVVPIPPDRLIVPPRAPFEISAMAVPEERVIFEDPVVPERERRPSTFPLSMEPPRVAKGFSVKVMEVGSETMFEVVDPLIVPVIVPSRVAKISVPEVIVL